MKLRLFLVSSIQCILLSSSWLLVNVNKKIILHTSKTIFISNRRTSLCYFKKPPLQFRKENGEGEYGNDVQQSRKHTGTVQSPLPRKPCRGTLLDFTQFVKDILVDLLLISFGKSRCKPLTYGRMNYKDTKPPMSAFL